MKKSLAVTIGLAAALSLSACGNHSTTEAANDAALANFDTPPDENILVENDLGGSDANVAIETNSLDDTGTGNTL